MGQYKKKFSIFDFPARSGARLGRHFSAVKGFTLIELLVVIGILGILAAALLATINPVAQLQKSNDARRKSDLESMQRALELYYNDNGKYPASSGTTMYINNAVVPWGSSWTPYMATLPKDPVSTQTYVYYSPAASAGQTYYLYANLQRGANDPDACNKGQACKSILSDPNSPGANACGGVCNYGVSSSNVSP
jgi:general secretion pathway protein G